MNDRIENFRYETGFGTVLQVYPDAWEVDVRAAGSSGIVYRATVLGPRLPEVSTPTRPQFVVFGFAHSSIGNPWCMPMPSRLFSGTRGHFVYWEEALNWRITINRDNEVEILHPTKQYHILLQEKDGVVRIETPKTRLVLKDVDGSVLVECDEKLTVHCKDAEVNVDAVANVTAGSSANVKAPAIELEGEVSIKGNTTIKGNVSVTGNVEATGTVIDATGNTPHHVHP